MHNLRHQGKRRASLAEDKAQQTPVYEPGKKKSRRRFCSCWLSVGFRSHLRLRQLPHFCSEAVENPVLPPEQAKGKVWGKKEQVAINYLSVF